MTTQAPSTMVAPRSSGALESLHTALGGSREPGSIVVANVPAPIAPLETLLEAAPSDDSLLWDPPDGRGFAALGVIETICGAGHGRIGEVRQRAEALWPRLCVVTPGDGAPLPRCFGGFAFEPGWGREEPWTGFGDARFVLPRYTYSRSGERAWLTLAMKSEEAASESRRRAAIASAEHLLTALRSAASLGPESCPLRERRVTRRIETSEAEWQALVEAIRVRIATGEFEKIVLARRMELAFDAEPSAARVLTELARSSEHCTRFAMRVGPVTFLGSTPERLVRRSGLDVETEALAGSSRPGDAARALELMQSTKERAEHEPVLREIVKGLAPLCSSLDYAAAPEVRALRHVLHLRTPVRGRLAEPVHVLDLVGRLHPTPAVGGTPAAEALRFIVDHEPVSRGWYASPIGWFDRSGDGEFAVALRSGVLVGERAYLYAGGGIVRDSDPASEYAETRLKLAALCAALHVAQ